MTLGKHLAAARTRKKLSQEQAALAIGVAQPTICTWERDDHRPSPKQLEAIARVYGLRLSALNRLWMSAHQERP